MLMLQYITCIILLVILICSDESFGFDVTAKQSSGILDNVDLPNIQRRNFLATSSLAILPWYFNSPSSMADPSSLITKSQSSLLAGQTKAAVSLITTENIDEYHSLGVTKISNVISNDWINLLREGCELAQDDAGPYAEYLNQPTDTGLFFTDLELARRLPIFAAFSIYSPVSAIAGTLMASTTVRYLYDQLFVKERGVSTITPWHQDGGYWRVKGEQLASVFVPLDVVHPDDGLQFVAGSHTWQLHNPQHFADGTQYSGTSLPSMPNISQLHDERKVKLLDFGLEPGDVLVFSAKTVHGGPGNWGRALSTRWVGDDGQFWNRPGEGAIPTVDAHLREGQSLSANPKLFPVTWHSN
jgi:ectoine hydroxylase-related dioxygenase (phytanoyl-CoA dioxygenase family)